MVDALSDLFSLIDVRSARCTRFEAGGSWSFSFPAKPALKFVAVLRGECWIMLPGESPQQLAAGDTFLLAEAPSYVLASDPQQRPEDGLSAFDWEHSDVARHGKVETVLVAGAFVFEALHARLLLDSLPSFTLIPAQDPTSAVLRSLLALLDREMRAEQMGAAMVTERLAEILLVQVLRGHVARQDGSAAGWIGAAADPRIGKALNLVHDDIAHGWRVDELARAVGMSRSAFAAEFKTRTGSPPLDYLLRWRMQVARDALRKGGTVAAIAAKIGYASESAFSTAFKRVYGSAPKRYWSEDVGRS
ncbi:AraC family transcriptional regulator [Bradyrhizobium sp. AS23.2]|uniref:AraC family transcriptional regulator n=1 Tax=Bradyrhizobium sp. AS23.2 TaxID=1680155 RepID=UPI00093F74BF|nr:AraC family transcriptional regulator [Bradyrhizobium sp. AS23.2]OKO85114.1 AraC family transcriptional regulator [Bradyrhizobium sp. AS23.2]